MNKLLKSESYLFFIAIVLYMLRLHTGMPYFIFLIYSLLLALYFFPLKIIFQFKSQKLIPLLVSSIIIAWLLSYANIVLYVEPNILLQIFMVIIMVLNIGLLYYFYKKQDDKMALHLLVFAFIPMILYG